MADASEQIRQLETAATAELEAAADAGALQAWRIKFLGANGQLKAAKKLLGTVPKEERPFLGQQLNGLDAKLNEAFTARQGVLGSTAAGMGSDIDVTEPGRQFAIGNKHILMKVVDELVELFGRMGFTVASGPEVEDEFHNFVALNIPRQHPARDPLDNFYLADHVDGTRRVQGERDPAPGTERPALRLLRTQTSTVQIRVLENQPPPVRVVIPGRVYRPDTHDATHLSMFHQLEALVVDQNVTMVDLKSTVLQFVKAYFGPETQVRFRPSFFPFTEPSAEVDVYFPDRDRWIELGGCGMVHPHVLKAVQLDPEVYSGWAFGFGIERIAMRKYGIADIRQFIENDLRFLRQF